MSRGTEGLEAEAATSPRHAAGTQLKHVTELKHAVSLTQLKHPTELKHVTALTKAEALKRGACRGTRLKHVTELMQLKHITKPKQGKHCR